MKNYQFIEMFETQISKYTNAPFVVLTDSCSNALFLALNNEKYENIEIPANTYISAINAVIHNNIRPTLTNNDWKEHYTLTPSKVIDAAVGFRPNMYISGTKMCLSFQEKKAIPIGKGGAILLDDETEYNRLKRLCFDGRDYKTNYRDDVVELGGYHMNMTPEHAAKGLLLLNQYKFTEDDIGSSDDYLDVRTLCSMKY